MRCHVLERVEYGDSPFTSLPDSRLIIIYGRVCERKVRFTSVYFILRTALPNALVDIVLYVL